MTIIEFKPGDRVTHPDEPEAIGTVERVDEQDGIVWVRWPVQGRQEGDLMDHDPLDLSFASF